MDTSKACVDPPVLRLENDFSIFHLPRLPKLILIAIIAKSYIPTLLLWLVVIASGLSTVFFGLLLDTRLLISLCVLGVSSTALLLTLLLIAFMITWLYHPYVTPNARGVILTMGAVSLSLWLVGLVVVPVVLAGALIVGTLIMFIYQDVDIALHEGIAPRVNAGLFAVVVASKLFRSPLGRKPAEMFVLARQIMAKSADDVLSSDCRKPVVYLRSFAMDESSSPNTLPYILDGWDNSALNPITWFRMQPPRLEDVICEGLSYVGPVVAIGRPGEQLPGLGAARTYVEDDAWKKEVERLVGMCGFACLLIGSSAGVRWEMDLLFSGRDERKMLLVFPQSGDFQRSWREVRAVASDHRINLPGQLPENCLAMLFCKGWNPVIVTGKPTIANYREIAWEMTKFNVCPDASSENGAG